MRTSTQRWLALGSLMIAVTLTGCGKDKGATQATADPGKAEAGHGKGEAEQHGKEEGKLKLSPSERELAKLAVEPLRPQAVPAQLVLTATIRANQDRIAHVAPRVPARVVGVSANLGDSVRAGQPLAQLDSIELGEAHAAYAQARSQLAVATADFERAKRLRADEIVPEKELIRARSEFEKAQATARAATDKLKLLDATHSDNESGPNSIFAVKAPFKGTIIEKQAVLGELAQPDKSMFTVADLSTVWIEANVFEKDLDRVAIGAPATVTVVAYPGRTFAGKVTYIASTVDKESRAVLARVEVPNPDGRLKPEMFATAAIATGGTEKLVTLPQAAVMIVNGQPTAFVEEGGEFEPRTIDLGDRVGDRVVVKSGLREGEQVVVDGAYALKARMLKSQIGDTH